jgi:hypothetical protein
MVDQCDKLNVCVDYMTAFLDMLKKPARSPCDEEEDECEESEEEEEEEE